MTTSASSALPATRRTGAITPVDVSLCGHAYTSTPSSATGSGCVPAADSITVGASRCGAFATAAANFAPNSPNTRCWLLRSISPNEADVPERRGPAVAEHHLVAVR